MSEYKDMVKIITEVEPGQGGGGHEEGDVWQTDSGWAAWKPGADFPEYGIKSKDAAEKYAKGEKVGYDDGDHEDDEEDSAGKLGKGDFDRDGGDSDDTSGFTSKNKPQKAKDLANDPSANPGSPDSRGTKWDASYYGADDSTEWESDYKKAAEYGDEEELAQIKWFGEKQGWGKNGELDQYQISSDDDDASDDDDDDASDDSSTYSKEEIDGLRKEVETAKKELDIATKELQSTKKSDSADRHDIKWAEEDYEQALKDVKNAQDELNDALEANMGRTGKELGKNETLKINGKMYRKVQEQKETSKKHPLREAYERIGGK